MVKPFEPVPVAPTALRSSRRGPVPTSAVEAEIEAIARQLDEQGIPPPSSRRGGPASGGSASGGAASEPSRSGVNAERGAAPYGQGSTQEPSDEAPDSRDPFRFEAHTMPPGMRGQLLRAELPLLDVDTFKDTLPPNLGLRAPVAPSSADEGAPSLPRASSAPHPPAGDSPPGVVLGVVLGVARDSGEVIAALRAAEAQSGAEGFVPREIPSSSLPPRVVRSVAPGDPQSALTPSERARARAEARGVLEPESRRFGSSTRDTFVAESEPGTESEPLAASASQRRNRLIFGGLALVALSGGALWWFGPAWGPGGAVDTPKAESVQGAATPASVQGAATPATVQGAAAPESVQGAATPATVPSAATPESVKAAPESVNTAPAAASAQRGHPAAAAVSAVPNKTTKSPKKPGSVLDDRLFRPEL